MRAYCEGCGRMRIITLVLNPHGSFFKIVDGIKVAPEQKRYCEECGRVQLKRMVEWGLKG